MISAQSVPVDLFPLTTQNSYAQGVDLSVFLKDEEK